MARFDLTDVECGIIVPLLPKAQDRPQGGRPTQDDRRVLTGIFFVLRTGTPWRDLPERYGPYTTVYNRFNRWAKTRRLAADLWAVSHGCSPAPTRALHTAHLIMSL